MSDNTDIRGGLVNRLRGLACPAGLAWTGTTPESDHGHTDCFIIHRAADALEAAEAELAENIGVIRLLRRQRDAAEAKLTAIEDLCARHGLTVEGIVALVDEVAKEPNPFFAQYVEFLRRLARGEEA